MKNLQFDTILCKIHSIVAEIYANTLDIASARFIFPSLFWNELNTYPTKRFNRVAGATPWTTPIFGLITEFGIFRKSFFLILGSPEIHHVHKKIASLFFGNISASTWPKSKSKVRFEICLF